MRKGIRISFDPGISESLGGAVKKPSYRELEQRIEELEQKLSRECAKQREERSEPETANLDSSSAQIDGLNRRRLEEAQKKSEQFLKAVFNAIPDGVTVLDPELNILSVNQTMKRWCRRQVPLEGKRCYTAFYGLETPCDPCPTRRAFQTGNTEMNEKLFTARGTVGTLELYAFPMFEVSGRISAVVEIARDVTLRKKTEEDKERIQTRLQEAQKMQAIATLAGGIAHQFNNALASISLSIDMIQMDLVENASFMGQAKKMKASVERMANLTSQLLAYAEGGRYHTRIITTHEFVREALPSVTHDLDPSMHVDTDLPPDTLCVRGDVTQLQMVLSALIHNSAEAIDGEGWIRVSTRNEIIDEKSPGRPQDLAPGTYVCLSVEDNGKGMDEKTLKRIFEPFFTTKFQGRGLGMPAVYGIVKGHDGCVAVDTKPGKGTRVRVYLPAVEPTEKRLEIREEGPLKGAGTVLLIEDEEMIMEVSRELLERVGYRVLTARTGKEALKISSGFGEKIDLVILDVVLPDLGGKEIYHKLLERRPDLKVLVCSGFSVEGPAQEILDAGAQGFIQKPFSLNDLSRKLNDILKKEA